MPATEVDTDVTGPGTVAGLLEALGGVNPESVLLQPFPGTATEQDWHDCEAKLVELYDATLVRKPMGLRESLWAVNLLKWLAVWNQSANAGVCSSPDGGFRLAPGLIRLPDASFTAWASLPHDTAHLQPMGDYAPDLAVEVLSRSERPGAIRRKRHEFFAAGTKLVWHIDPRAETVAVYTGPEDSVTLTRVDTLDGGTLLPGFSVSLAALFDDPQLQPRPQPAPQEATR